MEGEKGMARRDGLATTGNDVGSDPGRQYEGKRGRRDVEISNVRKWTVSVEGKVEGTECRPER